MGDGAENTGRVTSTKTRPAAKVTPAPKPSAKRRDRKAQAAETPATDNQGGEEARDDAPMAIEDDAKPVTCAECEDTFPGVQAATERYYATHGRGDGEPSEEPA